MRALAPPFVVARPTGARISTRLRLSLGDEAVLREVGAYLGHLAGQDLAVRCQLGQLGGGDLRADRKRALTAASSSRWAGTITRTSNDQWERGHANLLDQRVGLRRAVRRIGARLQVAVGNRQGRVRGYQSQTERFAKQRRLQHLQAKLDRVERGLAQGRVSVCRGGRRLAKLRRAVVGDGIGNGQHGQDGSKTEVARAEWRARWEAARLFLTADGEADKRWGNETIRVHPDQGWLEIRLPTPLAHLSNTPGRAATYRLGCPVRFTHRGQEWAAQAASGAVRYDIHLDPTRSMGRWYLDANWQLPRVEPPSLEELRRHRMFNIDLNADHLAGWVLDPSGNPVGAPHTIPLDLDGQPASVRDGRLRAAVAACIQQAKASGCRAITVENLDFADARQVGREALGRGARGKRFRRTISGIPTRGFRDLLAGMSANAGLWVIAVDAGWTSKWGARYWQAPLGNQARRSVTVTRHHAASVVIGRRGLGLGARRRPGVTACDRRIAGGELPARPGAGPGLVREPGGQEASGQRDPPHKTWLAERTGLGD
jgi:hypothetical protein